MYYYFYETEIGPLSIFSNGENLIGIDFSNQEVEGFEFKEDAVILQTIKEIKEYLKGERKTFDVKYKLTGTPFQKLILDLNAQIPYGEKLSYGEIAKKSGRGCARAVGTVMRKNPIPIIIPCHRVIGKGNPYAYSGGKGEHIKKFLIKLEDISID